MQHTFRDAKDYGQRGYVRRRCPPFGPGILLRRAHTAGRRTGLSREPVVSVPTSAVDGGLGSRLILSRRRRDAVLVLFEFPGQAEKTSYQIFVLSLQLGIVNLFRFLAKYLSQPFTIRAWVHDLRPTREPIEAFPPKSVNSANLMWNQLRGSI